MMPRLAALAVLDVATMLLCLVAGMSPAWALAAHAGLTALACILWVRSGRAAGLAPAVAAVLGPWALLALHALGPRHAPRRSDDEVFGPVATAPQARGGAGLSVARMLDGRIHHAGPETLGSLVTILRHGDVPARRRALETVVRSFEPSLSPVIALALTDGDQTIRALAAAASARVAQNLAAARTRLEGEEDAARPLAALLADHARSDVLLSDSQRGHLRDDAVALAPADDPLRIEAAWAAGDYDAIDRLTGEGGGATGDTVDWWRAESAA